MSAILSENAPMTDIADETACRLSEAEAIKNARRSFERWWGGRSPEQKQSTDGPFAWTMFKLGYLSMARELGHLPEGGAQ